VLTDMPTCANCHSFSGDGKTMGIDVDGPANDKGLYAVVPVARHMSIQNKDIVQWNSDGQAGKVRVGFMSQVSPDGRFVSARLPARRSIYRTRITSPTSGTIDFCKSSTRRGEFWSGTTGPPASAGLCPARMIRAMCRPTVCGARREIHCVCAGRSQGSLSAGRAKGASRQRCQRDANPIRSISGSVQRRQRRRSGADHRRIAKRNEQQLSKVSPDGRWIVFVQCRNGQLMRPDSQLYIVPFGGGTARRLHANTLLMNSWHSFSPNGRWLVFSSKARSPYTQMYLTHIDRDGNDSPAILIDNATASNRAVNIPEFVNTDGDGSKIYRFPPSISIS